MTYFKKLTRGGEISLPRGIFFDFPSVIFLYDPSLFPLGNSLKLSLCFKQGGKVA
jgi:hypothetical protein